ncbi:hypothetical protein [Mycobacterium sp. 141]|uniref:hypothetical protein n=1 Tax=Mycobacterium sp. 141 TaxID=1120797 RepID=UPI000370154A|nr:hypothetical protein [Mycobacterium sp. 141]
MVLLNMDRAGVLEFAAVLRDAAQHGGSRLEHAGVVHEFRIEPGATDIDPGPTHVVWRVDQARATEIIEDLEGLGEGEHRACHRYVDVIYPWEQPQVVATTPPHDNPTITATHQGAWPRTRIDEGIDFGQSCR